MKFKKGATVVTIAIITVVCVTMLCVFLAYMIEYITPFLLQQKLQTIAAKYMYVIEKYGYFTQDEVESLIQELKDKGFEQENILIDYPKIKRDYGELIEFTITYNYESKLKSMHLFGMDKKKIVVTKISYSKR